MGEQAPSDVVTFEHGAYMAHAIALAREASSLGEVPVGAVVVDKHGTVVGQGHNRCISACDPTAHAEIVALREAASHVGNYRLEDCRLYVTLEPCPMCLGAIFHSRIQSLIFGAWDPKGGACGSVVSLHGVAQLNPHCDVRGGLMEDVCGDILRKYFAQLREHQRSLRKPVREDALRLSEQALGVWLPQAYSCDHDDLKASRGLRIHTWSTKEPEGKTTDTLVFCIPSAGHWGFQFRDALQATLPSTTWLKCVDLPGQGKSDKTKSGWEFDTKFQLAVLDELLTKWSHSSEMLVAQGSGSALAMALAVERGPSVGKIVLIDPVLDPRAALSDSGGGAPRSLAQLMARLQFNAGSAIDPSALQAPYPDAGHAKGLLRSLKDRPYEGRETLVPAQPTGWSATSRITVYRIAPEMQSRVHAFLNHWGLDAVETHFLPEGASLPWTTLFAADNKVDPAILN